MHARGKTNRPERESIQRGHAKESPTKKYARKKWVREKGNHVIERVSRREGMQVGGKGGKGGVQE